MNSKKQEETALCFRVLQELTSQPSNKRNLLQQIASVLHEAVYFPLSPLQAKQPPLLRIEKGRECFVLIRQTQEEILAIQKQTKDCEITLANEISLQKELKQTLQTLDVSCHY